eukprot:CAMPEP_0182605728 /NCGR_PEP_ID=MMETSP1330-20130603/668_1 /TAXON_ID=464278 /ORGANISM="Picochlorum sp., Strain RCC944" /LENGTH=130 /DNA_ID=CAMNT_0024823805 /DNA_START=220 /DNA_END=612 /DNA_ORIENTATION=+
MSTKILLVAFLALLSVFSVASATFCYWGAGGMSCCMKSRSNSGLLKCKKCEKGYKLSSSKMQCVPDHGCPAGQGPGHKGIDKDGSCFDCSDDNCENCAIVYTSCVRCKDGYLKDEWNQCYNLLGGNVTYY